MRTRMRAAVAVLILALLGTIVPSVSAHAAAPALAHRTPHAVAHARLVGAVGTVNMTWHASFVSVAWPESLEFAKYHVMIVAKQTPYAYTYTYTGRSWANVWFSHFPPDSSPDAAGYAVYVYGSDFWGNTGPVRLSRLDTVQSSQNVSTSDPGWKLKVPSLVKRCTANGLGVAGGTIVTGAILSAAASIVPPAEAITVPGTLLSAAALGAGTVWACFASHALGGDKASKIGHKAVRHHHGRAT